jgi:hypothetical protein
LSTALLSKTMAVSALAKGALGGARVSAAGAVVPVGRGACDLLEPPTAAGGWASAALGPLSCKPEEVEPASAASNSYIPESKSPMGRATSCVERVMPMRAS